jgi:hypothetical protein
MAYIGAVAPGYDPTRASVPQLDAERFSGDASTTAFTLTRQVVSPTDIDVIVENVTQEPTVAYSVNGYTLTFTGAPGSGTNNIYVIYRASAVSNYAFVPDGSITYAKLANNIRQFTVDTFTANGTGSTVALTETPASANSLIVSVDGVIQTAPSNYTLSGSTITFTGVPDNNSNVVVKHIGFRTTSTVTALQAASVTATELADGSVTNAKIVAVANTKITGNIISSQITSDPTLYGNVSVTGNLTTTGNTILGDASTDTLNVGNGGLVKDASGNVGIGTASPTKKLQVVTNTATDGILISGSTNPRLQVIDTTNSVTLEMISGDSIATIRTDTNHDLSFGTNSTEQARITAAGLFQFNSGYGSVATAYGCRAWVNFNGTGTVAIRASGNVSSITDGGVGTYTVNLTNAMPDANYSVQSLADGAGITIQAAASNTNGRTASNYQVNTYNGALTPSFAVTDFVAVMSAIFR